MEWLLRSEPFRAPVLFGTVVTGELVTLRRAFATRIGNDCEFVANELLVGAHVPEDAEDNVQSALAEFTHLDEWAYKPQFQFEQGNDRTRMGLSFPLEPLELLRVDAASPFKKLTIAAWVQQQMMGAGAKLRFQVRTSLRADFESAQSIANARRALDLVANVLSLLVGEAVLPTKIRLVSRVNSQLVPIDVFLPLRQRRLRMKYGHDMVLPLSEIAGQAVQLIRRWIVEEETLRPVYSLLLSTVQGAGQYVQSTYLTLTQALESFHRIVHGGHYASDEAYDTVKKALVKAIPAEVPEDLRNKLEIMLSYGNQFSLRKRLNGLFETVGPTLADLFLGKEKKADFISKVVDIRNYLTHHDETSSPGIATIANDTTQMYNLNQRLRAFTTVLIFKHLGMQENHLTRFFSIRNLALAR